jgi:cytochrome P450
MYKSVEKESINDKFIEEISEDFSTLFLAGTETTTYSEMMLLYYIMLPKDNEEA